MSAGGEEIDKFAFAGMITDVEDAMRALMSGKGFQGNSVFGFRLFRVGCFVFVSLVGFGAGEKVIGSERVFSS